MASIELKGISKNFGGVRALIDVSVGFEPGQVHALLGENGAGKSTLIKILTGAVQPSSGELLIGGEAVVVENPRRAQSLGIAAVYQEPTVYPHMSVLENLFMGQELRGRLGTVDRRAMSNAAAPLLDRLRLGTDILYRRMGSLSIGYQQLVLIIQALLRESRMIIFDEPTSILSREETERLFRIIEELRADGTHIVYITHRLEEVHRIADRVTVLTNGEVKGSYPIEEVSRDKLLQLMTGHSGNAGHGGQGGRGAPAGEVAVLELEHLTVDGYSENVNWSFPEGCVTGIYGLVGSGRSETALAVFGHLPVSAGTIRLEGREIRPRHPAEAVGLGIGYLPEDRQLQGVFLNKALEQNLTSNALGHFVRGLDLLNLKGMREFGRRLMDQYNIKAPGPETVISALSGGNQQKGLFARWANLPLKILILDEPTRGIDIGAKEEIHRFVRQIADRGMAVVVISSDLDEVLSVSDRIIVMRKGTVAREFSEPPFKADAVLAEAIGSGTVHEAHAAEAR